MCLTILGQIVYGGLMLCALALTLGGMFTKGWRSQIDPHGNDDGQQGIFQCDPDVIKQANRDSCEDWLKGLEAWQWVVVVSVVLAAVFQLLALIWTVFSFLSCCCKKHILHPLTGLAAVATIFLIIVVVVFGVKNRDQLDSDLKNVQDNGSNALGKAGNLGYSYFLVCGSLALSFINIFVGAIAAFFADRGV